VATVSYLLGESTTDSPPAPGREDPPSTLPALEDAHIRPYAEQGPNDVRNGLLLRCDLHRPFDAGYLKIDPDGRVVVSRRIREEFENGREYYRFDGRPLANLPGPEEAPDASFLAWHNENVFEAGSS